LVAALRTEDELTEVVQQLQARNAGGKAPHQYCHLAVLGYHGSNAPRMVERVGKRRGQLRRLCG
jgi:hypothetical protein